MEKNISANENLADLVSGDITSTELLFSKFWWYGPSWLNEDGVPQLHIAEIEELLKKEIG